MRYFNQRQSLRFIHITHFEEVEVTILLLKVTNGRFDDSRHQASPHIRELFGNWIHNRNGCIAAIAFRQEHISQPILMHKGEGDNLRTTDASQEMFYFLFQGFLIGHRPRFEEGPWRGGYNVVIAIDTTYFFCDIRHYSAVITPGRNGSNNSMALLFQVEF